jgi:hypothetical protein
MILRKMIRRELVLRQVVIISLVVAAVTFSPIVIVPFLDSLPEGIGVVLIFPLIGAVCGFVSLIVWSNSKCNPQRTRQWLEFYLAPHGAVEEVVDRIDKELATDDLLRIGSFPSVPNAVTQRAWTVTRSWLIEFDPSSFCLLPLDDVFWVYKVIVVRPTLMGGRLTYQVCITAATEVQHYLPVLTEYEADDIVAELVRRRPYILVGYQLPYDDLVEEGVATVRAAVGRRKTRWQRMSADDREDWLDNRLDEAHRYVNRHDPQLRALE